MKKTGKLQGLQEKSSIQVLREDRKQFNMQSNIINLLLIG